MKYTIKLPDNYVKPTLPAPSKDWVHALRTTTLPQGQGSLCSEGRYCCLGVLEKLAGHLYSCGNNADGLQGTLGENSPLFANLNYCGRLPLGVRVLVGDSELDQLSACNDRSLTFPQIADIIDTVWTTT